MKETYIETSLIVNKNNEKFFSFKSECSCFSHDLKIQLRKDDNPEIISLSFYDDVYISEDYDCGNWFKKLIFKIKCAFKCLFCDGFEIEHEFVFKGKKHLKQFQDYFNEAANEILKDYNKKQKINYKRRTYQKKNISNGGK